MIAGECYHHLLAKRVARTWRRFVTHKREERQRELEQMEKARRFCEKKMWYAFIIVKFKKCIFDSNLLLYKSFTGNTVLNDLKRTYC